MVVDKGQLFKTVGWSAILAGAYMVYLGSMYEDVVTRIRPDDDVIDAEFTILDD
jgi:hypothetical protein